MTVSQADGSQKVYAYVPGGDRQEIITADFHDGFPDLPIQFAGHHNSRYRDPGSSYRTYETVGFSFTAKPGKTQTSSGFDGAKKVKIENSDPVSSGGYDTFVNDKITVTRDVSDETLYYYSIEKERLYSKLAKFIEDKDLKADSSGKYHIYMSYIFMTCTKWVGSDGITPTKAKVTSGKIYDLASMRAADAWSDATYSLLAAYYDIELTVEASEFDNSGAGGGSGTDPGTDPEQGGSNPGTDPGPTPPVVPGNDIVTREVSVNETSPSLRAVIGADSPGYERFDVARAVPTTESLYTYVTADDYLLQLDILKVTGSKTYPVSVSQPVRVTWTEKETVPTGKTDKEGNPVLEEKTVNRSTNLKLSFTVNVTRSYTFYMIDNLAAYSPSGAVVVNDTLSESGMASMTASGIVPPAISFSANSDVSSHYSFSPGQVTLPAKNYDAGAGLPSLSDIRGMTPSVSEVSSRAGNMSVKNDSLTIGGVVILNGSTCTNSSGTAPSPNSSGIRSAVTTPVYSLYAAGITIPASLSNGNYYSDARVTYARYASYRTNASATKTFSIGNVNDVFVHTPVVCAPIVNDDNSCFVQLASPDTSKVPIVLDNKDSCCETCDFSVAVSNTGSHLSERGYGYRDYSKYLASDGGLPMNQVCFDFDVWLDEGEDRLTANDRFITKGTWVTIGTATVRFYADEWVSEGNHLASFRSVAVNGRYRADTGQSFANYSSSCYAATGIREYEMSGKLYGLRLTGATDRDYEGVFDLVSFYPVGLFDRFGRKTTHSASFTLPTVPGCHPLYKNLGPLKAGYKWRLELETTGNRVACGECRIVVNPTFRFISKDAGVDIPVDLYCDRTENGRLLRFVRIGHFDAPCEVIKEGGRVWSFSYELPPRVYACVKDLDLANESLRRGGLTSNDDFWKKDGYIVVNFEIYAADSSGRRYIEYTKASGTGFCMWKLEKGSDIVTDWYGNVFSVKEGDALLVRADRSASEDFVTGGMK